MARYRKVDVRIWGDEDFRAFSDRGKTLWLYLITAPESTSVPGLFCASRFGIADALGWSLKSFDKAFAEVSAKGKVVADWAARVVWVRNACQYNAPESPNVVTGWAPHVDEVPECDLKREALVHLLHFVEGLTEAYRKAFAKAFAKAFPEGFPEGFGEGYPKASRKPTGKSRARACVPDQEQEQEQEQERERERERRQAPVAEAAPTPPQVASQDTPEPEGTDPEESDSELPPTDPTEKGWAIWRELYRTSRRKYGTYVDAGDDAGVMRQIAGKARLVAVERSREHGGRAIEHEATVLAHWFKRYLRDSGKESETGKGFLVDRRHALRFLLQSVTEYGLPWKADEPPADPGPEFDRQVTDLFAIPGGRG